MKRTTYQVPELRDENDNIIQQGAFGKNTALANSTNDGWIDYVANDLEALYNNTMGGTGGEINTETITGKTGTIANLTATAVKAGTVTADALNGPLTGNVTGDLNGNVTGNLTGNVTGTADKAVADGSGNNIVNTYVTKSALASSVTTATGKVTTLTATDNTLTNVTITGETSVPTANAGNSSKAIANTEFVQGELTNYLPLSGGTLTGVVNGVTPTAGDNSTKIATTAFVNAKAQEAKDTAQEAKDIAQEAKAVADDAKDEAAGAKAPTGVVQAFAGSTIPSGWLLCDGSAVSRTTYAALFSVIGTTYGTGNGSTTFNLPNLVDKFVEGSATAGTVKSAGLPNITGAASNLRETDGPSKTVTNGALYFSNNTEKWPNSAEEATTNYQSDLCLDASRSNSIYGKSTTVQPPALTMRYIIKY